MKPIGPFWSGGKKLPGQKTFPGVASAFLIDGKPVIIAAPNAEMLSTIVGTLGLLEVSESKFMDVSIDVLPKEKIQGGES